MQRSDTTPQGKPWHALDVKAVVRLIDTDIDSGLTSEEAAARLEQYGPNAVSRVRRKSVVQMLLRQFTDPLVLVLLMAAVITFLLEDYIDTGVILAVVIINAIIGFIQEERAESAIESLTKLLKVESVVVRDGRNVPISSEDIVPGDIVVLQSGDKVPADIRVVEEKNLQSDESILTGESAPVSKSSHKVAEDDPVSDRVSMLYSGTLVTAGNARGVAVATGDITEVGIISRLIAGAPDIATPLTRKLARFGKWLTAAIIVVAGLTFGLGVLAGEPAQMMFSAAVAIAVAMIPEGLPAIVTIVLAVGVKRMADRNSIIRNLPSVETLGSVTVICSDKTGTLTANEMTVRRVHAGGYEYELGGVGYNPDADGVVPVDTDESKLQYRAFIECLRCGLLCNESDLLRKDEEWVPNGDPTEVALIVAAAKIGLDREAERKSHCRVDVVPFESSKMYMATLNENSDGDRMIYAKGSLEKILGMCSDAMADGDHSPLDADRVLARSEDLAHQGYRLLGFAMKAVPADVQSLDDEDLAEMTFLGFQAMSDPSRPEVIEAIRECREAGIKVKMITGDHVVTARAIARDIGLVGESELKAVTGSELETIPDEEFADSVAATTVFARVAPEQKYRLVEALQSRGQIVAMTGDGVNDAPALKKADIGVAMGKAGSDVAKDASDMVLTDDNFASIVAAVEEGRTVFSNLLKTLAFILPTNAGEGLIIIVALLGGYLLPVTPVQLLWINTVTAVTLALPLAFEPLEAGVMKLPPRRPDAPIVSRELLIRIGTVGIYMVVAGFAVFLLERAAGVPLSQARTAAVSTIVAVEVFYLFVARSERIPVWELGLFSNPYVWIGVPLVALLQLAFVYVPIMNVFFGSAPLPGRVWAEVILLSFPVALVVMAEKAIKRRFWPER